MDYDRGRKRGRSPNRRFRGRGYRRGGNNARGNYYQHRQNWNHYNNYYTFQYPPKPPSPLPGTEEYQQRNIQQTSELIKKQLNIDKDTCNNSANPIVEPLPQPTPEKEKTPPKEPPRKPNSKSKKSPVETEEIDVQQIYDKIINHISNLSYSKKLHLINQSSPGYDLAIQQIQKQKQLELSKALRDMSQRPTQDTDENIIQSIVPDIGIKLEDLPNNVIEELSKTLQVKFECDEGVGVVEMNISPNEQTDDEMTSAVHDVIDNIFDFEYLNKTDGFDEDQVMGETAEEVLEKGGDGMEFSIDVNKSYLGSMGALDLIGKSAVDSDQITGSGAGTIRVKTDIFETPEKEKIKDKGPGKEPVIKEKSLPQSTALVDESKASTSKSNFPKQSNSTVTSEKIDKANSNQTLSNSSPNHQSSNIFSKNFNITATIEKTQNSHRPPKSPVFNQIHQPKTSSSTASSSTANIVPNENSSDSNALPSPFPRQNVHLHVSPLIRDQQTPPQQAFDVAPKKWKSPGEKKMLPIENPMTTDPPIEKVDNKIEKSSEEKSSSKDSKDSKNKSKQKKKHKKSPTRKSDTETDTHSKSEAKPAKTYKDVSVMANFEAKQKHKRKKTIEVQTEFSEWPRRELKEASTMTGEPESITISTQTPMKFFKKNVPVNVQAVQTTQISYRHVDIQAVKPCKNVGIQTEGDIDEARNKLAVYMEQMKLMQEIDGQIKELLAKKWSIYKNLEPLTPTRDNESVCSKSKKKKRAKSKKEEKKSLEVNSEPSSESKLDNENEIVVPTNEASPSQTGIPNINQVDLLGEPKTSEKISKKTIDNKESSVRSEEITKNKRGNSSSRETDHQLDKNKIIKYQEPKEKEKEKEKSIKEVHKLSKDPSADEKNKLIKIAHKTTPKESENNPIKLNLKVERDGTNTKKYSLKRDRSHNSADREPKAKKVAVEAVAEQHVEISLHQQPPKRLKVTKEIECFISNDNKFLQKCSVKIKPLNTALTEEIQLEKIKEEPTAEEDSRCSIDKVEQELNLICPPCEATPSPHSTSSTCSNSSGKQRSKVIDKLEFKGLRGSIFALKSIDDVLLAAGDDGTLYFFNVVTQELGSSISLSNQALTCLHVTKAADECLIYITGFDGNFRIIDFAKKEIAKTVYVGHGIQSMDVAWGYAFMGSTLGQLDIYNIKTGKLEEPINIFDNRIYAIKAAQEGARRVLLITSKDSELSIRDAMTGLLMRSVHTKYSPTIYSILTDQNLIYCGTNQHDVLVYSFQDGELVKKYESITSRRVVCMQIVDNLLFVGCFNGSVCVFHKSTHQYLGHMIRPRESLLSMLIVNNKVIVGLKNNKLVSWDVPAVYLEKNR